MMSILPEISTQTKIKLVNFNKTSQENLFKSLKVFFYIPEAK